MEIRRIVGIALLAMLPSMAVAAPGDFVWQKGFGGTVLADTAVANALAVDGSGNVVVTGELQHTVDFGGTNLTSAGDKDIFVAKYAAADGALVWAKRFGSTSTDVGYGVATDSSGNVYVTGIYNLSVNFGGGGLPSFGNGDVFLLKLDSSGNHVWSSGYGGSGTDRGNAIAVTGSVIALVGSFGFFGDHQINFGSGALVSEGDYDVFAAKFTTMGGPLWSKRFGGTLADQGLAVAIDSSGNVAASGIFRGTMTPVLGCMPSLVSNGDQDGFVVDLAAANGSTQWMRALGGGGTSTDQANAVAMGPSGEVVVSGSFNGTANFGGSTHVSTGGTDVYVVKYTSAGTFVWDVAVGTGFPLGEGTFAAAIDGSGNVIVGGAQIEPIDFGCGALADNGTSNAFVVKLTAAAGACVWSHWAGDAGGDERTTGIAADAGGNVLVGGYYPSTINWGGGVLTSPGGFNGFAAKFLP